MKIRRQNGRYTVVSEQDVKIKIANNLHIIYKLLTLF